MSQAYCFLAELTLEPSKLKRNRTWTYFFAFFPPINKFYPNMARTGSQAVHDRILWWVLGLPVFFTLVSYSISTYPLNINLFFSLAWYIADLTSYNLGYHLYAYWFSVLHLQPRLSSLVLELCCLAVDAGHLKN